MFKKLILTFILSLTVGTGVTMASKAPVDSMRVFASRSELTDITRIRRACSLVPVTINIKGRTLSVESPRIQLLPVYCYGGSFYCSFKLNKGVNLINGLPRGTYVINNRKYTIS
jgi:hypothetical protein